MTRQSKNNFLILIVIGIAYSIFVRAAYSQALLQEQTNVPVRTLHLKLNPPTLSTPSTPSTNLPVALPLKVPFTSQAPLTIWDPLHEEACEEASLLMVYYYRTGQKFASPLEADSEIKKLVAWEEQNGYKVDLTAKELVAVAAGYMELKTGRVILSPTVDQLKAELVAGRPVIVPAAGRELHNPNFTAPGPIYHMLVLKSYDETGFIVNDPGTRRGENYHYGFKPIMDAMHDWDPDNILNGQKAVVVFD